MKSILHTHIFILIFIYCIPQITSGPLSRNRLTKREVYPEVEQTVLVGSQTQVCIVGDVVYGTDENVPSEQPCLRCKCSPPEVKCETTICVQQPGCKALHKSNKCCPDYQCECHHEGKLYANGERVPAADGAECLVCYCRGGEVQCAEVGCYTRNDCEPRKVPGQCCPKYDHCPPREPLSDRIQLITESSTNTLEAEGIQKDSPDVKVDDGDEGSGDISLSSEGFISSTTNTIPQWTAKHESTPSTVATKEAPTLDKSTQTEPGRFQITIQEVIPARTEYRITDKVNYVTPVEVSTSDSLVMDDANELVDSQTYASEKTEVYDHPPPVLRIGDQLLFLKQGQLVPGQDTSTPSPVITIKGAEGLQIGLDSEEVLEHDIIHTISSEPVTLRPSESAVHLTAFTADSDQPLVVQKTLPEDDAQTERSVPTSTTPEGPSSGAESTPASKTDTFTNTEILPEENPYYPPIPEDLAILGQEEVEYSTSQLPKWKTTGDHRGDDNRTVATADERIKDGNVAPSNVPETTSILPDFVSDTTNKPDEFENKMASSIIQVQSTAGSEPDVGSSDSATTAITEATKEITFAEKIERKNKEIPESKQNPTETKNSGAEEVTMVNDEIGTEHSTEENRASDDADTDNPIVLKIEKILPEVLELRNNQSISNNGTGYSQEWLKSITTESIQTSKETERITFIAPLINEKAVLSDSLLRATFPSDAEESATESEQLETTTQITESTSSWTVEPTSAPLDTSDAVQKTSDLLKTDIIDAEIKYLLTHELESTDVHTETSEPTTTEMATTATDATKSSTNCTDQSSNSTDAESTTRTINERIVFEADADAKVEDTSGEDKSDRSRELVANKEDVEDSGESTTNKGEGASAFSNENASVEGEQDDSSQLETSELVEMLPGFEKTEASQPEEMETNRDKDESPSPKNEVEMIDLEKGSRVKPSDEIKTHEEMTTRRRDEIQKRDVVKKVLKDTFVNPKENIMTELADGPAQQGERHNAHAAMLAEPEERAARTEMKRDDDSDISESSVLIDSQLRDILRDFLKARCAPETDAVA